MVKRVTPGIPDVRESQYPGTGCSRQSCFMLSVELIVLTLVVWRLYSPIWPFPNGTAPTEVTTSPSSLTRRDVLPTPTVDVSSPMRLITFPGASMSAPVIPAGRVQGTWETRHLGDSVGHLVGTSWFDDPGGNIVLAGHVESASGEPGPFAYLFEAKVGDLVILRDGAREEDYRVTVIKHVGPTDVSFVAQDGHPRVTLITCTDWDYEQQTYLGRLVVVAEPVEIAAQGADR
jgi:LPXTG-site transpeptidase (sortase) family protein